MNTAVTITTITTPTAGHSSHASSTNASPAVDSIQDPPHEETKREPLHWLRLRDKKRGMYAIVLLQTSLDRERIRTDVAHTLQQLKTPNQTCVQRAQLMFDVALGQWALGYAKDALSRMLQIMDRIHDNGVLHLCCALLGNDTSVRMAYLGQAWTLLERSNEWTVAVDIVRWATTTTTTTVPDGLAAWAHARVAWECGYASEATRAASDARRLGIEPHTQDHALTRMHATCRAGVKEQETEACLEWKRHVEIDTTCIRSMMALHDLEVRLDRQFTTTPVIQRACQLNPDSFALVQGRKRVEERQETKTDPTLLSTLMQLNPLRDEVYECRVLESVEQPRWSDLCMRILLNSVAHPTEILVPGAWYTGVNKDTSDTVAAHLTTAIRAVCKQQWSHVVEPIHRAAQSLAANNHPDEYVPRALLMIQFIQRLVRHHFSYVPAPTDNDARCPNGDLASVVGELNHHHCSALIEYGLGQTAIQCNEFNVAVHHLSMAIQSWNDVCRTRIAPDLVASKRHPVDRRTYTLRGRHAPFFFHRGWAWEQLHEYARALVDYEMALAQEPTSDMYRLAQTRAWNLLYNVTVQHTDEPNGPNNNSNDNNVLATHMAERLCYMTYECRVALLMHMNDPFRYCGSLQTKHMDDSEWVLLPCVVDRDPDRLKHRLSRLPGQDPPTPRARLLALVYAVYTQNQEAVDIWEQDFTERKEVSFEWTMEDGRTPMHYACMHGNNQMILQLNRMGMTFWQPDMWGRTPWHMAAERGRIDTLAELSTGYNFGEWSLAYDHGYKRPSDIAFDTGFLAEARIMNKLEHDHLQKQTESATQATEVAEAATVTSVPPVSLTVVSSTVSPPLLPVEVVVSLPAAADDTKKETTRRQDEAAAASAGVNDDTKETTTAGVNDDTKETAAPPTCPSLDFTESFQTFTGKGRPLEQGLVFPDAPTSNIVHPRYAPNTYYVYQKLLPKLTVTSPFPTADHETYADYLLKRHGQVADPSSPIFQGQCYAMIASDTENNGRLMNLVQWGMNCLRFSVDVVERIKGIPHFLYELEHWFNVHELRSKIGLPLPLERVHWALVASSAQEVKSYERHEFLGDSALKFLVSIGLYDRFPYESEEQLTIRRSRLVGNNSLFGRAKAQNLHRYILCSPFSTKAWQPPGVYRGPTQGTGPTPKLCADVVEALIGVAFVTGGRVMARAMMTWFGLPSDFTPAEKILKGETRDADGPFPATAPIVNPFMEEERFMAYLRSRDLIQMEILKGARLTLISEIREVRKQLEENTRSGHHIRAFLSRQTEHVGQLDTPYMPGASQVLEQVKAQIPPLRSWFAVPDNPDPTWYASARGWSVTMDGRSIREYVDPYVPVQVVNDRTRMIAWVFAMLVTQQVNQLLEGNVNRSVKLLSRLKQLEDEVQGVDRQRERAEKNDLMNAAYKSSRTLQESNESKNGGGRHETFSIIKAHRHPDQKYLHAILHIQDIERRIHYTFRNKFLLLQALTHGSYVYAEGPTFQRLEFLGDAILEFLITHAIFQAHPKLSPGDLTLLRQAKVCNMAFGLAALRCNLQRYLMHYSPAITHAINDFIQDQYRYDNESMVSADDAHPPDPPKVLGDMYEAMIAAVYLDSGRSMATAWKVYCITQDGQESQVNNTNELDEKLMAIDPNNPVDESFPAHEAKQSMIL